MPLAQISQAPISFEHNAEVKEVVDIEPKVGVVSFRLRSCLAREVDDRNVPPYPKKVATCFSVSGRAFKSNGLKFRFINCDRVSALGLPRYGPFKLLYGFLWGRALIDKS